MYLLFSAVLSWTFCFADPIYLPIRHLPMWPHDRNVISMSARTCRVAIYPFISRLLEIWILFIEVDLIYRNWPYINLVEVTTRLGYCRLQSLPPNLEMAFISICTICIMYKSQINWEINTRVGWDLHCQVLK